MPQHQGQEWRLDEDAAAAYERYLVPAFFTACADVLLDTVGLASGERMLDVACGTGIVARRAKTRVGALGSVAGVDLNEGMLRVAGRAARAIHWRRGDVTALPFADGAFDVVCCQQGLQFFSERLAALRELRRVLAVDGGRLAVAVWRPIIFSPAFVILTDALARHLGDHAAAVLHQPFSAPSESQLRTLFTAAGFADPRFEVATLDVRFPSAEEFLRQEAASSPLAGFFVGIDDRVRQALVDDLSHGLRSYVDDQGIGFAMQTWLITAAVLA